MKKMFIDPQMGAAGDMMAAAFLDMFDNPEEVLKMINKGIKEAGLDEVFATIMKEKAENQEGLGFDVDIHGQKEGVHHHGHHHGSCRKRHPIGPSVNIIIEDGININLTIGEPKRCKKKHHHHHRHHHGPKSGAKVRKARPPKPSTALRTKKDHLI